jgi:hypothetical protein
MQMLRIAAEQPLAETFTDTGSESELASPPDRNFHHANFYWRLELQPEAQATIRSSVTIGNDDLGMMPNECRGKVVRITKGKGRGQERTILEHDETTLTLAISWDIDPDESSYFVIAEQTWNFGAMSQSSPVVFEVPNRENATIHISGRAANVHDRECSYELSPLTRYTIGGGAADSDVAQAPIFGLATTMRGSLEVTGIGFESFENTKSVTAGSLTLFFWNELAGQSSVQLADAADDASSTIFLYPAGSASEGQLLQVGGEIMVVVGAEEGGEQYEVVRGAYGTEASAHTAGATVYPLERKVFVLPFLRGFFGSTASGSYAHSISLPNVRISAAEMFVTNTKGNSQVAKASYTGLSGRGLRTLSGGQFSMQIHGPVAVQSNAVPPLSVESAYSVRDVYATVNQAPTGQPIVARVTNNGEPYCELTIEADETASNVVQGADLPPLDADCSLGLDIISAGDASSSTPGAGLTVTIRV